MLTELEVKTLQKFASGSLVKQIACNERVSHSAIDKRVKSIKRKLKAKTLAECIYKAAKSGIICLLITATTSLELEIAINPDFTDLDMQRRISRRIKTRSKREINLI
ncbi:signal transduction response regulator, C-terminal effector [Vibrio phage 1.198.B._10N.286.54.F4]|nr:signal transduction response regulator, C-terminal effector [Vibrio phage 1.198.A._10N.286.54.F4]AUR94833.1 signal transduction response regulator, C-terminal effector [Vibrio phage 1.198.B._10N.286.54.F4]